MKIFEAEAPENFKSTVLGLNYLGILKYLSGKRHEASILWEKSLLLDSSGKQALSYINTARLQTNFLTKLLRKLPHIMKGQNYELL